MESSFRLGDVPSPLGPMRLTVGGLAEITSRLDVADLPSLAEAVRAMRPDTARDLATVLLRPCGHESKVASLADADVAALMPAAARCISHALATRS